MTNVFRTFKVLVVAAMALTIAVPALAQQPTPAGQTPATPYVVGQAKPPVTPGSTLMNLTLEQATAIALEKNLDLKVARMNPQSVDYQLQSARAAFMTRYSTSYSYNNSTSPSNDTAQGVANVIGATQNFNGNIAQLLPWHGGSLTAGFTNSRATSNAANVRLNPSFNTRLNVSYSQPLLAGFKIDNTRNQLRTLAISRQISDIQLLGTIENTKANVRTSYWSLRQAIEQIEIAQRALDLANRLYQDNRIKVEIGTLAPIETTQSESQVANAEQSLLAANISWRTAELNFKRILASGPEDDLYKATINPTEQPIMAVQSVDIPGAVQTAIKDRTDIVQSRKNLEISNLNLEVTRNQTKPNLALSTGFNSSGQGGNRLQNGVVITPGGYTDAFRALTGFNTSGWNLGLDFTVPFGRDITNARINYARALLTLDQDQARLKVTELTISSTVTNAGLAVENSYKQFQAAQKAREVAERNSDAEQTRFEVGMSTNYNVVLAQNNLTTQRLNELRALIGYLNAVAEFNRVQRVGGNN